MRRATILLGPLPLLLLGGAHQNQVVVVDSCVTGPYMVFFDPGTAYLDKQARDMLDNAATYIGPCGGQVSVTAHTDTTERARIAEKRGEVVRDYLAARGIPRSDIKPQAYGAKRLRVPTGPNVAERNNRRVEITFEPWRH